MGGWESTWATIGYRKECPRQGENDGKAKRGTRMGERLFSLKGRVALVTGATQGLGVAIARGLGEAGATVVVNGREVGKTEKAAAGLRRDGVDAFASAFDVRSTLSVHPAVTQVENTVGPIDILVNNAGVTVRKPLCRLTDDDWNLVTGVNLDGPFVVSRAVVPYMVGRGRGKIINTCSLLSDLGRSDNAAYAAAKGGLRMLTRQMAVELGAAGVQVNGVAPGYFETPLTTDLLHEEQFGSWIRARTPMARWGRPEELIGAFVFLASDASSFITGQIIVVDGGVSSAI